MTPPNRPRSAEPKTSSSAAAESVFCDTPLAEERPYWEEFVDLVRVQDAHARSRCRDLNGEEPWACCECDCTSRLEAKLTGEGEPFLTKLRGVTGP